MTTAAVSSVRGAAHSEPVDKLARLGLATRATLYLLIGWLALMVARGDRGKEADQSGALHEVARHSGGTVLLWVIAAGLAGYALWRFSQAAFGVPGEGKKAMPRFQSFVRGVIYAFFAVNCVHLLLTSHGTNQARKTQLLTGEVLGNTAGRWLVGAAGAIVVLVALFLVYEGIAQKFEKHLNTGAMSRTEHRVVAVLGTVGTVARGLVFGLAGVLVVRAALDYDPKKARGLDGALKSLANSSAGAPLLIAAAIGLMVFGVYGYTEARWART